MTMYDWHRLSASLHIEVETDRFLINTHTICSLWKSVNLSHEIFGSELGCDEFTVTTPLSGDFGV